MREQERRYDDLEVEARETYRHVGTDLFMEGIITQQSKTLRSVLRVPLAYFTSNESFTEAGGTRSESAEVEAFDGQWTRILRRDTRDRKEGHNLATLRKGGDGKAEGRHDGIPVLRPHTFAVRNDWIYGPLADLLVSPWHDKVNKYRLRFRYCGEEVLDGHPCVKLRSDVLIGEGDQPHNSMAFWLATDRNYIPIKMEPYGGNLGSLSTLTGLYRSDDFHEIAPGLWYPFRTTILAFNNRALASRRLTLNWRRELRSSRSSSRPGGTTLSSTSSCRPERRSRSSPRMATTWASSSRASRASPRSLRPDTSRCWPTRRSATTSSRPARRRCRPLSASPPRSSPKADLAQWRPADLEGTAREGGHPRLLGRVVRPLP